MSKSRLLRCSASIGLLVALAITFIYISFLSPIVLDMWPAAARGVSFYSSLDFLSAAFEAYVRTYSHGNPRLGQFFLYLSGASDSVRILLNFVCLAALITAAFTIITGRLFRPWRPADALVVLLFLSLVWAFHREAGQQFFYMPFTANYLLAYAILLAFLIPYRLALIHPFFPAERGLAFALPLIGIGAGLTNEHTPPVYIAMIGASLALLPLKRQRWIWMASGLAGLAIGFTMLFFAPGQSRRYGGMKFEAMEFDFGTKLHKAGEITSQFVGKGWGLASLVGLVVTSGLICFRRGGWCGITANQRDAVTAAALLTIAAIGMMLPLLVSPIVVPRLFFAPHVNLAMATAAVLLAISGAPAWRTVLGVTALGANAFFFSKAYMAYSAYHAQFVERVWSIQSQKAAGASFVVMPGYTLKFNVISRYVYKDPCWPDPNQYPNPQKAKYFGVRSVAMDCAQR